MITVVTASVNRPGLKRAVASVQAQTVRPVRHCVLLQQLMREPIVQLDAPSAVPIDIRWLPPPQPNMAEAYNAAVAMAETEFVAILDDDCWWEPHHLSVLLEMIQTTGADFVWSSSILEDEVTGEWVRLRDDDRPMFECIDTNEILFRRTCLDRWGGFRWEDHRGIDGRMIERWVRLGAKYAHSHEYTVHYGWRDKPEFDVEVA